MSNYTKATNFATKDALPTGNALKIVSGTEIDTEFSNIETAVNTKADTSAMTAADALKANIASPTFTGVPAAPTATAGTNTTQVATTEFVKAAADTKLPLAGGTLTGDLNVPSVTASGIVSDSGGNVRAGRKNLIINGRLGSDTMVNQRGFTSGTLADDAYGFDRWMSKSGASSITLNASNITLTSGKLVQIIENPFISGESVTVSASVSSGTLTGRLGTTDAFQTLPFTTTAPSGDIRLELVGNGSVFTNVQLELGSVATDFEHRSYGEELALCQRYFHKNGPFTDSLGYGYLPAYTDTYRHINYLWPVTMRATPSMSVTWNAGSNWTARWGSVNGANMYVNIGDNTTSVHLTSVTADAEL